MPDFRRSARARKQSWYGLKKYAKTALSLPGVHLAMRTVARRVPGVAIGRLPAPRGLREVTGYVDGAQYVMLRPDRCEIAKELYWGEGRRPDPADAFALDLIVELAKDARAFLDIGAYTGVFTFAVTAANPGLHAQAFEIIPAVTQALRHNAERNGVTDRVTVRDVGVGDPDMTMRAPTGDSGSALPSFYSADMAFDDGAEVGFVSLDSLTDVVTGPVVVKIDVEGGEQVLLRHGQEFLARHRPDVLCEVLSDADGAALQDLVRPHGLRLYAVGARSVQPRERLEPDRAHRDWLFTAREPQELRARGVAVVD